jgi:TraK protein
MRSSSLLGFLVGAVACVASLVITAAAQERAPGAEVPTVRLTPWTGQPVTVNVAVGRTTAITFPAAITSIVTTASKETLTLETVGSRLFLSPLAPQYSGEIFVILVNDEQVPLIARSVAAEDADLAVRLVAGSAAASTASDGSGAWTPLRLMRAMILDVQEPGVTVTRSAQPSIVYDDSVLVLRTLTTWKTPRYEGVALEAENKTDQWLRLALESLHFPGLLAVHAERESLAPRPAKADDALAAQQKMKVYLVRVPE